MNLTIELFSALQKFLVNFQYNFLEYKSDGNQCSREHGKEIFVSQLFNFALS